MSLVFGILFVFYNLPTFAYSNEEKMSVEDFCNLKISLYNDFLIKKNHKEWFLDDELARIKEYGKLVNLYRQIELERIARSVDRGSVPVSYKVLEKYSRIKYIAKHRAEYNPKYKKEYVKKYDVRYDVKNNTTYSTGYIRISVIAVMQKTCLKEGF